MKRRSLQIVCVLTILASLLTVTVAFAQGEDPGRENPVIQFLSSLTGLTPEEIAAGQRIRGSRPEPRQGLGRDVQECGPASRRRRTRPGMDDRTRSCQT